MGFFTSTKSKKSNNLNNIWREAAQQQGGKLLSNNTALSSSSTNFKNPNPLSSNLKQIWVEASAKERQFNNQPRPQPQPLPQPQPITYDDSYYRNDSYNDISNLNSSGDVITVNGITGVWVNKDECMNWRGPIPIEQYKINQDPDPTIIRKKRTQSVDATQRISVRYLKPPLPPVPGDLIIREEGHSQLPPAPPIIIRQEATGVSRAAPLVIREKPPRPPSNVPTQTITIPGGRTLDPPPRQVIIERMPATVSGAQDIVVERWLGYPRQKRNIVYQRGHSVDGQAKYETPQNIIIDWETTGHAVDTRDNVNRKVNFLGVETADPIEYAHRHSNELLESHKLPNLVNELNVPQEETLAASGIRNNEFILTGDVDALKLVNRDELNKYLLTEF